MVKPTTIAKSAKITEALDKMLEFGIDPLIAVNNNSVVGTVSRKAIAEKQGSKQNSGLAPTTLATWKLVVVYDSDHKLIGQVSRGDLLKKYQPDGGLDDATEKAVTIEAEERVVHLRRRMLDDNITRFIVSEHEKYTGIVTETDVAIAMRKFRESIGDNHQDHQIRNLLVKDIMSAPLISVERTAKVSDVVTMMLKKNISSVPVMDKGKLAGMVTRSSLVNAL